MAAKGVTSSARVGVIKVRASSVQGAEPVQRVTNKVLAARCCINHGQRRGEASLLPGRLDEKLHGRNISCLQNKSSNKRISYYCGPLIKLASTKVFYFYL